MENSTMQALVWLGPREMVERAEPMPTLADEDVLISVGAVGIEGSELIGCVGVHSLGVPPRIMGAVPRPGAFAQYVAVPARQCYPLPDQLSLVAGSMAEQLACSIRAVALSG